MPTRDLADEREAERMRVAAIVQGVAEQIRSGQIQVRAGSATDAAAILASVLAALLARRA